MKIHLEVAIGIDTAYKLIRAQWVLFPCSSSISSPTGFRIAYALKKYKKSLASRCAWLILCLQQISWKPKQKIWLFRLRNWQDPIKSRRIKVKLHSVSMLTPNYMHMGFAETAIIPRVAINKQLVVSTKIANFTRVQFVKAVTLEFSIAELNQTRKLNQWRRSDRV